MIYAGLVVSLCRRNSGLRLSKAEVLRLLGSHLTSHNHLLIDASQLAGFYVTAKDVCTIYVGFVCVNDVQLFSSNWTYGSGG